MNYPASAPDHTCNTIIKRNPQLSSFSGIPPNTIDDYVLNRSTFISVTSVLKRIVINFFSACGKLLPGARVSGVAAFALASTLRQ